MINAYEARKLAPIKEDTVRFLWEKIETYILDAVSEKTYAVVPLSENEYWSLKGHGKKGCGFEYYYQILEPLVNLGYKFEIEESLSFSSGGFLIIYWDDD